MMTVTIDEKMKNLRICTLSNLRSKIHNYWKIIIDSDNECRHLEKRRLEGDWSNECRSVEKIIKPT